jgi:hypothetical protein
MTDGTKKLAAVALVAAAVLSQGFDGVPQPEPDGGLVLKFAGVTAAGDARIVANMAGEIADCIEYDGKRDKPRMTAATHFDDLRTWAREFRCRGERIGDRQPAVNEAVHKYLDQQLGESGGPVTPEQRQKWIDAYREISRAASVAK